VNELKEAFEFFDHDKDGSLSKDDIKKAVKELGTYNNTNRERGREREDESEMQLERASWDDAAAPV